MYGAARVIVIYSNKTEQTFKSDSPPPAPCVNKLFTKKERIFRLFYFLGVLHHHRRSLSVTLSSRAAPRSRFIIIFFTRKTLFPEAPEHRARRIVHRASYRFTTSALLNGISYATRLDRSTHSHTRHTRICRTGSKGCYYTHTHTRILLPRGEILLRGKK